MLSFELMAPLMFAGLIVFLLLGYPVAFSLSAVGLAFGAIAIHLGYFQFVLLQAFPSASSASSATSCCWPSRSSPSWAPFWSDAGWRKTCSIRWGSCSGRSAAASPTP